MHLTTIIVIYKHININKIIFIVKLNKININAYRQQI